MPQSDWKGWVTDLRESLSLRKVKEEKWIRWLATYQHSDPLIDTNTGEVLGNPTTYSVPMARSLLSIILPSLYFRNPFVLVQPLVLDSMESSRSAQAMEAYINYFLGVLPVKKHIRKCILDAMIYNEAYLAVRWKQPLEDTPTKGNGNNYFHTDIPSDSPYLERQSPWDESHDPYSLDNLANARWYGERSWVPIDYVRNNSAFNAQTNSIVRRLGPLGNSS
jgi:hypothetical protein